jgi:hypothetical protein
MTQLSSSAEPVDIVLSRHVGRHFSDWPLRGKWSSGPYHRFPRKEAFTESQDPAVMIKELSVNGLIQLASIVRK